MPLSKTEIDVPRLLAAHRDPESDVAGGTMAQLREAFHDAEAFISRVPTDQAGLPFLSGAEVVQPGSAGISSAMLERYRKPGASSAPARVS